MQAEDVRASFSFVDDFNGHRQVLSSGYTLSGCIDKVDGFKVDSLLRLHRFILCTGRSEGTAKASYSSRPGSAWDSTNVLLIL